MRWAAFARRLVLILLFMTPTLGLAACNTVEGVGQDLSNSARAVKEAL